MSYIKEYADKLTTAEEAVKVIKSGDWVDYGWTCATVDKLDEALCARMSELSDLKIRGGILMKMPKIFELEDAAEHFTWNSWHLSGFERKGVAKGFVYHAPVRYSELPRYYRDTPNPPDVAMFQVSPMDKHGFFSFGPNASHMMEVVNRAKVVIVEVNESMPRVLGVEESIHISQVDMIVEGDNPAIAELPAGGAPTDVDIAVAKQIVEQIPNGACLQLGIGGARHGDSLQAKRREGSARSSRHRRRCHDRRGSL